MNKKDNEKIVREIVGEAKKVGELTSTYVSEELRENALNLKITDKTIENVVRWSLKGTSAREIAENLEMTQQEFNILLSSSPALMWALQKGEAMAQAYLSFSAYELAIGGRKMKKEVLSTVRERDENGRVVKEYQEPIEISYELPPDSAMMKFLLQSHIPNRYGDIQKQKEEQEMRTIIDSLSDEERQNISKYGKQKLSVDINGLFENVNNKGKKDDSEEN